MTGSRWRLLAAFLLVFVAIVFSRGQDVAADRSATSPNLTPMPRAPLATAVRRPEPLGLPWRHPVAPGTIGLPTIFRAAGIIFSGQVTAVDAAVGRAGSYLGQDAVSTTVTFQVENAVRGTSVGQSLTIHEWAGLWANGERYRVGERVMLFLYSPSKLGLTSPVARPMGRFAIDSQGRIVINAQSVAAVASDPVIGGRSLVPYADFMRAIRRAGGEE
jgi:hypothetical protein